MLHKYETTAWKRAKAPPALVIPALFAAALAACESGSTDTAASGSNGGTQTTGPLPVSTTVISLDDHHAVGTTHWSDGSTANGGTGQPVDGFDCIYPSPNTFHIHTHLSIFLDGQALAIPADIGIAQSQSGECHYPLHTHDNTGMIHVHATGPMPFYLGEFFDIWGQPLESMNIAGLVNLPVVVYVSDNGVVREVSDFRNIDLVSHREITIQVGTPIAQIPRFAWSGQ